MNNDINIHHTILAPYQIKEKKEILEDLKNLWIETFGDSREYIDLLYDTYIDEALIGIAVADNDSVNSTNTRHKGGEIIGALTAIPYRFRDEQIKEREEDPYFDKDNLILREPSERENAPENRDIIRGWYLCGLATIPPLRGRNIMGKLMRMSEEEIKKMGDRLLFLIPADDRLALYYERKGYVAGMKRSCMFLPKIERRTFSDDTRRTNDTINIGGFKRSVRDEICEFNHSQQIVLSEVKFSELNDSGREEIVEFLMNHEKAENIGIGLIHSEKDWITILRENEISGGKIFISKISNSHKITSVAFTYRINHTDFGNEEPSEENELEIRSIIGDPVSKYEFIANMRERTNVIMYFYHDQNKELVEFIDKSEELSEEGAHRLAEGHITSNLGDKAEGTDNSKRNKIVQNRTYIMVKIFDKKECNDTTILNHKLMKSENKEFEICDKPSSKFRVFKNEQNREVACQIEDLIEEGRVNATLLLD